MQRTLNSECTDIQQQPFSQANLSASEQLNMLGALMISVS